MESFMPKGKVPQYLLARRVDFRTGIGAVE
jgi:hypothetical protein